jgi:predicted MFS family arabinose efflux permease
MVFVVLAAVTAAVALIILTVVPERRSEPSAETLREQVRQLARIFTDRAFLAIAPLLATTAGTHLAIQTLWAGPWFRDVAGLGRVEIANNLFIVGVAFFAGILGSGWIADWFVRRGFSEMTVMTGFLVAYFFSQAGIVLELHDFRQLLWFVFGMSGQVAILAYPWLSTRFGTALSGRANTAMNLLIFITAFGLQYAIGLVINLFPPGAAGGYDPAAYRLAFGLSLAVQVLCFALYLANRRLFRSA